MKLKTYYVVKMFETWSSGFIRNCCHLTIDFSSSVCQRLYTSQLDIAFASFDLDFDQAHALLFLLLELLLKRFLDHNGKR